MIDVATIGECMTAIRSSRPLRFGGQVELSVAGSESNVAIGLARLGHNSAWVGSVGDDEPGQLILRTLLAEGVGVSHAQTVDASTGFVTFDLLCTSAGPARPRCYVVGS
jgi:2-dehydro-3-deoxygluconokinase